MIMKTKYLFIIAVIFICFGCKSSPKINLNYDEIYNNSFGFLKQIIVEDSIKCKFIVIYSKPTDSNIVHYKNNYYLIQCGCLIKNEQPCPLILGFELKNINNTITIDNNSYKHLVISKCFGSEYGVDFLIKNNKILGGIGENRYVYGNACEFYYIVSTDDLSTPIK